MKLHRFFVTIPLRAGFARVLDAELANQLKNVLKIAIGEKIILVNEDGFEAEAALKKISKNEIEVEIESVAANTSEPSSQITLYLAILKNENVELAVQKAVECGASTIIPIITARTVKLGIKLARLQKIAKEAAEQSGRGKIPEVREPEQFVDSLHFAKSFDRGCICDITGEPAQKVFTGPIQTVGIWIGPEGGFSTEEIEQAKTAGLQPVNLGQLTLRAETAAMIATYLATH